MHSIKLSGYRIEIKFDKNPLALEKLLEQNCKFLHGLYLDAWPKIPLRNFTIKNCLSGATFIVKNSDKEKWMYSGYRIAFDGKGGWIVVIFGVGTSSSSYIDNSKNTFLILDEEDTFGINRSFSAPEKNLVVTFVYQGYYNCIIIVQIVIC